MTISRRALMLGLTAAPLAACSPNREVGSRVDEGTFGNPTAHNILVLTGQMPYVIDLSERFVADVPTTVYFPFNSTHLDAEARTVLLRQAAWMRHFPEVRFRVYGHTDLVGSAAYNRRLGLRRARTVVQFLVRNGVNRACLEAVVTRGQSEPAVQTADRERQNRRTVTEVSGFWQSHPMVLNGEYAAIVHRRYVDSAS